MSWLPSLRRGSAVAVMLGFGLTAAGTPAVGQDLDGDPGLDEQADEAQQDAGVEVLEDELPSPDELSAVGVSAQPPEDPSTVPDLEALGWVSVLDEEFDDGGLDDTVWRPMNMGGVYHGEGLRMDDTHPGEDPDGFLTMTTFSRKDRSGTLRHHAPRITTGQSGRGWATAEAGFLPTYGYVEARVKMDKEQGTTTAFWLMPRTGHGSPFRDPGASGPEFTIAEWGDQFLQGGMHWDELTWQGGENHKQEHHTGPPGQSPSEDEFHTWGALWTPDGYRMYFDGEEYLRSDYGVTYNPEQLILSMAAGSNVPGGGYGDIDESTNQMVVDHVKWWQKPVSSIPDQSTGVNEPLSVPFSVTDYFSSSPDHANPDSVRVTATSSDQEVVADTGLAVAGNGSADPGGSLTNADFEDGSQGWDLTGEASIWDGDAHAGSHSLRLEQEDGGRAAQTISGLEPDTTYMLGTRFNLEVGWTDLNGNGYVDCGDTGELGPCKDEDGPVEPIEDGLAAFDWGVVDVDASREDDQTVRWKRHRNGGQERSSTQGRRVNQNEFREDYLVFTTGPDTTEMDVYFDNTMYAGTSEDSDVSVDSLYVRPMAPPDRTLAVQPEAGATGEATITLTAVDEDDQVLGTQDLTVSVDDNASFANGSFGALPVGDGWSLPDAADVVVEDPFASNRVLQLSFTDPLSVATQEITGLEPDTSYTLEITGKGAFVYDFDHDGDDPCTWIGCVLSSDDWETQSVTFTTGPSGSGTVELADLFDDNANALVDNLRLMRLEGDPPEMAAPIFIDLEEQQLTAGRTHTVLVDQLSGNIDSVTSSNPDLLPDRAIVLAGEGRYRTLSLTPLPHRTGKATLTFEYSDGSTAETFELPLVVSDGRLQNPGFETDATGWTLPEGATLVGDGQQRTGGTALELGDTGGTPVQQTAAVLDYNTPYVLSGHVKGEVDVTVTTTPYESSDNPETVTATWSGSDWEEGQLMFTPGQCAGCSLMPGGFNYWEEGGTVEILLEDADPGDGPSLVDDLALAYAPSLPTMSEMTVTKDQTEVTWQNRHAFSVGQIPGDARWRDDVASLSSSDESVMPTEDLLLNPDHPATRQQDRASWPYEWSIIPRSNGVTGRSDVTLTLSDPSTGASSSETWPVTVNAGTFDNGDFERRMDGWQNTAGTFRRDGIRFRRPWRHLEVDYDQVLRMWLGRRGYKVSDLNTADPSDPPEPDEEYVVQGNAFGDGSQVVVKANDEANGWDGTTLAEVAVDNSDGWEAFDELRFTPLADEPTTSRNESDVWIFLVDTAYDPGESVVPRDPDCTDAACRDAELTDYYNYYPCHRYRLGQTCFDDLGLFRATDID